MKTGCFYVVRARDRVISENSAQEAVKRGPERVKLKNLHGYSRCQGTVDEDIPGWKKA
jgi:hypothetical protein